MRTVYFEESNESRAVVSRCQVCFRSWLGPMQKGDGIVSPAGVEHIQDPYVSDRTVCGHRATGEKWWWPL